MAAQNICFFHKYGFCKYLETCRNYHENEICEKLNCEIRICKLRHPKVCRFYRDLGFCKFSEWCKFSHKVSNKAVKNDKVKEIESKLKILEENLEKNKEDVLQLEEVKEKLVTVEVKLEKSNEKVLKLEAEIKDINLKFSQKEQTLNKVNKKFNVLKEKVTLFFDLEEQFDNLEKKFDKIVNETDRNVKKNDNLEIKCSLCDFVAKNEFGLKIHFHKKHSSYRFRCFTCDFKCESKSELVEHNDKYYYSHRLALNRDHEKHILEEFQKLKEDGFLVHRTLDW